MHHTFFVKWLNYLIKVHIGVHFNLFSCSNIKNIYAKSCVFEKNIRLLYCQKGNPFDLPILNNPNQLIQ